MQSATSFTIKVNNVHYVIGTYHERNTVFYEVLTNCEKLFTLWKDDYGNWNTKEEDVIPINENLAENIGNAIEEAETNG